MEVTLKMGLLGAGRLGTALACELARRGRPFRFIADLRGEKAKELAGKAEADAAAAEDLVAYCDLIVIAVPDDAIAGAALQLSRSGDWVDKIVIHTSGSLDSTVLSPLKEGGAHVGSFHPMQSFSGGPQIPSGTVFGIEGDADAVQAAAELSDLLEGSFVELTPAKKPLYHAAASIAANYLVTLMDTAQRMLETAGLDEKQARHALLPLVGGVLENLRSNGTVKSLTGPIARGDAKTIEKHLTALAEFHPELRELYTVLGEKTLELARKAGLDEEKAEMVGKKLNSINN